MCGIAGILNINDFPEKGTLQGMINIMRHRGPDGEGIYIDGPAALGHRRLSIIDLDTGAQPMSNEACPECNRRNGSIWITYNGEIYNFKELRLELEGKGHNFRTKSDTETIIHAYEEYGHDCLKKLRGMFAFGIWNAKKRSLFLARDRLGKKPLYYFFDGKRFVFASEIKAIISDRNIKREIDMSAVSDYFTYQYIPFPKTIFKNIYKLPPAHYMTVRIVQDVRNVQNVQSNEVIEQVKQSNSSNIFHEQSNRTSRTSIAIEQLEHLELSVHQYWDVQYEPDYKLSEDDWVEGLRDKLTESVKMRLISDVPLGAFLSGGMDSSSIVAIMSICSGIPVKTFSIGFDEKNYNEVRYARLVAEHFKTDHHEMIVRPDAVEILPKLAWEFDEPFADSSAIPTYYVSKMAREYITVVLSGDGGDETFAGYSRYAGAFNYKKVDVLPQVFRKLVFGGVSSLLPPGIKGKGLLRHLSETGFKRYAGMITQDEPGYLESLFSRDVKKEIRRNKDYIFLKQFYDRYPDNDYLSKIQYLDTKTYLAEDILTKIDRASMLCSLETRAPLLDHELIEFAAKIPHGLKLNSGIKKYIFKKAMEGILPKEILSRAKMGFNMPLTSWFKGDLSSYSRNVLLDKKSIERGFFSRKGIEAILHNHKKRGRDLSPKIWALLFFEHWCRNWLDVC